MLLPPQDAQLFFKLHRAFMFFVHQRLQVLPEKIESADHFSSLPPEKRLKVREALLNETDLIERFVNENPAGLSEEELDIVHSWRDLVAGEFILLRQLQKYAVFLDTKEPPTAYGVLALAQPFEIVVGVCLPVMTETVLLPFQGQIVYDGLLSSYNVSFGRGIRGSFNETYQRAKKRRGIITSLPAQAMPKGAGKPRRKVKKKKRTANPFVGRWRIDSMEMWDDDYIHEEGEGHFEFEESRSGSFRFGYVRAEMDYLLDERDGRPAAEFTFEGNAEMDPTTGRGWCVVDGDRLSGKIVFHGGDASGFVATKQGRAPARKKRGK